MNLLDQSLGQIARDLPGATAVLHRYKLDFCCGGERTLRQAAMARDLDVELVLASLEQLPEAETEASQWSQADNETLIEHILTRYHDVHREQLPELIRLSARVERVHGVRPDCPAGLTAHLEQMAVDLEHHMRKEEDVLFPMITRGMQGMAAHPARMMRHEHQDHGRMLERLDTLTNGGQAPADACNTWQALYAGLAALKTDLMDHIHLENNVLFARVDGQMGGERHG